MHKPLYSLVFGISIFSILALLSFIFPMGGIKLTVGTTLGFFDLSSVFNTPAHREDVLEIIERANAIDTSFTINDPTEEKNKKTKESGSSENKTNPGESVKLADTSPTVEKKDSVSALITTIQMRHKNVLKKFFDALHELKNDPTAIRVLHYGDSQIEGDRITDYIRQKLQGQFGGQGPGLISLMPLSNSIINRIKNGPGWDRYSIFTMKDKRVSHSNYGVLACFNRFANYKRITDTSSIITSSVSITTTKFGGSNAMSYKKLKLFYGGAQKRTWCEFYDGPALIAADSLEPGGILRLKEFQVGNGSYIHTLKFRGLDSPDFYAISLEGDEGVMVDNIALRGSSGTFFHQINNGQLKQFYDYLNVKLLILQFGGNSLPAINDPEMAINYSNYIKYQIALLKKMAPQASILFIGPSDMSIKKGTEYVTYPYLENMRDALKKVVLESDCAFFDMYACMGGKNSMSSWVEQKLAATDYTHFSPQGARKIATLFYSELIKEYNLYLREKN